MACAMGGTTMSSPPLLLVAMEVETTKPQAAVKLNNSQGQDGRSITIRISLLSLRCSRVYVEICAKSARVSDRGQLMLSRDQPSEALFCREHVHSSWTKPEFARTLGSIHQSRDWRKTDCLFSRPAGTSDKHFTMSQYEQPLLLIIL